MRRFTHSGVSMSLSMRIVRLSGFLSARNSLTSFEAGNFPVVSRYTLRMNSESEESSEGRTFSFLSFAATNSSMKLFV